NCAGLVTLAFDCVKLLEKFAALITPDRIAVPEVKPVPARLSPRAEVRYMVKKFGVPEASAKFAVVLPPADEMDVNVSRKPATKVKKLPPVPFVNTGSPPTVFAVPRLAW